MDRHQENYSQIEKEGLSIVFGVKRFHQFLYGRKFILLTDHKPLVNLFTSNKHLPTMTGHRIQRWAITLMAYQFKIRYRKTSDHSNAAISRLPIGPDTNFDSEEETCFHISFEDFSIKYDIKKYFKADTNLRTVYNFVKNGWPNQLSPQQADLKPLFSRRNNSNPQSPVLFRNRQHPCHHI